MKRSDKCGVRSAECRVKGRKRTRHDDTKRAAPDPDPFMLAKDFGL